MIAPNSLANLKRGGIQDHLEGKEIDYRSKGRTPNHIRQRMREGLESYVERLIALGQDESAKLSVGEIAKAADALGKFGLGEKTFELDDEQVLSEVNRFTAQWFKDRNEPEVYDSWFAGLTAHFKGL